MSKSFEDDHAAFKSALAEMADALEFAGLAAAVSEKVIVLDNSKRLDGQQRDARHRTANAIRELARQCIAEATKHLEGR